MPVKDWVYLLVTYICDDQDQRSHVVNDISLIIVSVYQVVDFNRNQQECRDLKMN